MLIGIIRKEDLPEGHYIGSVSFAGNAHAFKDGALRPLCGTTTGSRVYTSDLLQHVECGRCTTILRRQKERAEMLAARSEIIRVTTGTYGTIHASHDPVYYRPICGSRTERKRFMRTTSNLPVDCGRCKTILKQRGQNGS